MLVLFVHRLIITTSGKQTRLAPWEQPNISQPTWEFKLECEYGCADNPAITENIDILRKLVNILDA